MIVINIIKKNKIDAIPERQLSDEEKGTILKDENGFLLQWGNADRHIYWQPGDERTKEWEEWQSILKTLSNNNLPL